MYKFRIRERKSAMGGILYIPEFYKEFTGWRKIFNTWQEVLKDGYDGPRQFGDLTTAGPRYCCSHDAALYAIEKFKKRGFKNPKPRLTVTAVE